MRVTIDKAGRLVRPKPLRDRVGLQPGEVEVYADGAGRRIEAIAVVPSSGAAIDDDLVRALRDADQR